MRIRLFICAVLLPVCTLGVREAFSQDQRSASAETVALLSVSIGAQGLVNFNGRSNSAYESTISALRSGEVVDHTSTSHASPPSSATGSNQVAQRREEEERKREEELRREEEKKRLEAVRLEEERKREEERRRHEEERKR